MTMRRGFALVAVLWVVVALSGMALAATSRAQVGAAAAGDRILAVRGRWAAEACLAASHAELDERARAGRPLQPLLLDTIALADGSRCAVDVIDSTEARPAGGVPSTQRPSERLLLSARGWVDGRPGAARLDLLMIAAGARVAPVRRRVW